MQPAALLMAPVQEQVVGVRRFALFLQYPFGSASGELSPKLKWPAGSVARRAEPTVARKRLPRWLGTCLPSETRASRDEL